MILPDFRRSRAGACCRNVAVSATLRGGVLTIGGVTATRRADSLRVPRVKRAKAAATTDDSGRPWRSVAVRGGGRANGRTSKEDGERRKTTGSESKTEKERERERVGTNLR